MNYFGISVLDTNYRCQKSAYLRSALSKLHQSVREGNNLVYCVTVQCRVHCTFTNAHGTLLQMSQCPECREVYTEGFRRHRFVFIIVNE